MTVQGMVDRLQLGDHICAVVDGVDERLDAMVRVAAFGTDVIP
jgi:hypothetical protein